MRRYKSNEMNYEILISTRQNHFKDYFEGRLIEHMGRKEMRKQLKKEQKRTNKTGKNWMYATLTAVGGVIGVSTTSASAQAAETTPQANAGVEIDTGKVLANNNTATIPAASTSNSMAAPTSASNSVNRLH